MKRKYYIFIALVIIAAMLFAACSGTATATSAPQGGFPGKSIGDSSSENREPAAMPSAAPPVQEGLSAGVTGNGSDAGLDTGSILQPGVNRKVVYNGNIEANTKTFDDDYNKIMSNLKTDGGYVQSSTISGTKPQSWQDAGRYAQMVLRVPSAKFDSFMDMLKGVGENTSSSISGDDISLQYFDTEAKLSNLRIRQQRLQALLSNPNYPLVDLIPVEKELSDVSYQIQTLETDKRNYDSLIDFSTINITLHEVSDITGITPQKEDLGTQISNGFFSVLNALADFGQWLLVFITAGSPVLILIAVIVIVIVVLVKRSQKKHRANALPPYPQGGQNQGTQNNKGGQNNDK